MLGWLRKKRRERLLEAPFPAEWERILGENVRHYEHLSPDERERLRRDLRVFIAEKHWEGCGGLKLTPEMQVTIAAQACLLTLNLPHDYYPNVQSIFVYPAGFRSVQRQTGPAGVVTERKVERIGEAWTTGAMVLSWAHARDGGADADDGRNVVLHEFAHKLDMEDRQADGAPLLDDEAACERWSAVMGAGYRELVAASRARRVTVLDEYGAQDPAEFFAVATEAFFERAQALREQHPDLYGVLLGFYRQDPAARLDG